MVHFYISQDQLACTNSSNIGRIGMAAILKKKEKPRQKLANKETRIKKIQSEIK